MVYGQVSKKKRQGRLHEVVYRVCGGARRWEQLGLSSSTCWIERLHRTLWHALAPRVRKRWSICTDRPHMRGRVVLLQAFSNVARPHRSLRLPVPEPERHASGFIQPTWGHHTPGRAAGLTDHIWTFRALLTVKCDPVQNQSSSG